jgi:hypothetical protein
MLSGNGAPGSATWPAANRAIYVPLRVATPTVFSQAWLKNGSAVSGNVDIGIYSADGTRLVSTGSTAQSGTNAYQTIDMTDTLVGRGLYYIALSIDNTTATTFRRNLDAASMRGVGVAQEASASPLPASATFAAVVSAYMPEFGVLGRTVAL